MPGIMDIYVSHAENHIANRVEEGAIHEISRKQVELEVLQVLDKHHFPIEMKMAWYHAVLCSPLFESIWRGAALRYNIPTANLARYVPDESQLDFQIPPGMEMYMQDNQDVPSPRPKQRAKPARGLHRSTSSRNNKPTTFPFKPCQNRAPSPISSESSTSTDDTSTPTPSQMALAAKLGTTAGTPTSAPVSQRTHVNENDLSSQYPIPDPHGLIRQTGDDGTYNGSSKPSFSSHQPSPKQTASAGPKAGGILARKSAKHHVSGNVKFAKGSAVENLKAQRLKLGGR